MLMFSEELAALAAHEATISWANEFWAGHIEHRDIRLHAFGIFDQYARIFDKYVALAAEGSIEALKRAVFISWFRITEPWFITGILELPPTAMQALTELLSSHAVPDDELTLMLSYYLAFEEWPAPPLHAQLQQALAETSPNSWRNLSQRPMDGRGLMGDYWGSVLASAAL